MRGLPVQAHQCGMCIVLVLYYKMLYILKSEVVMVPTLSSLAPCDATSNDKVVMIRNVGFQGYVSVQ